MPRHRRAKFLFVYGAPRGHFALGQRARTFVSDPDQSAPSSSTRRRGLLANFAAPRRARRVMVMFILRRRFGSGVSAEHSYLQTETTTSGRSPIMISRSWSSRRRPPRQSQRSSQKYQRTDGARAEEIGGVVRLSPLPAMPHLNTAGDGGPLLPYGDASSSRSLLKIDGGI